MQAKDMDAALKEQLLEMSTDEEQIENSFYEHLTFGTGGMRGILGPGINRMNIYTVRKAVQGLAFYLKKNRVNYKDRGVVIAYDYRYMSKEFEREDAIVHGVYGISDMCVASFS